jgi:hypothetical protein
MNHVAVGFSNTMADYISSVATGKLSAKDLSAYIKSVNSYNAFVEKHLPKVPNYCENVSVTAATIGGILSPGLIPTIAKCFSDFGLWTATKAFESILLFYQAYWKEKTKLEPAIPYESTVGSEDPETLIVPQFEDIISPIPALTKIIGDVGLADLGVLIPDDLRDLSAKAGAAFSSLTALGMMGGVALLFILLKKD